MSSGGLFVILTEDSGQLPPVGDIPPYSTARSRRLHTFGRISNVGRTLILLFKYSDVLDTVVRQDGYDPARLSVHVTLEIGRAH
ncbi:MAG: hypothetical protein TREMPRED_003373, partial [Tremellales sp. Tagirdzhanova-0007]